MMERQTDRMTARSSCRRQRERGADTGDLQQGSVGEQPCKCGGHAWLGGAGCLAAGEGEGQCGAGRRSSAVRTSRAEGGSTCSGYLDAALSV